MRRQAHPQFVFAKDGFYDDISRVHRLRLQSHGGLSLGLLSLGHAPLRRL